MLARPGKANFENGFCSPAKNRSIKIEIPIMENSVETTVDETANA